MVRRPERGPAQERPRREREAGGGVHPGRVERLGVVEIRQQPGETGGQHRLPGTGWPDEQEVMPSGGGDLEREARHALAADVGEIGTGWLGHHRRRVRRVGPRQLATERGDDVGQGLHRPHLVAADERCLGVRGRGDHDDGRVDGVDQGQRPRDRPHGAVEPQLPEEAAARRGVRRHVAVGGEQAHGDGQVQPGALLADPRRGQVHRHPAQRPRQRRRQQRGAHPVAGLATGGVGQPDHGEAGQAVRDMHLDADGVTLDAVQHGRRDGGEHDSSSNRRTRRRK